jgi:hypothetical protein
VQGKKVENCELPTVAKIIPGAVDDLNPSGLSPTDTGGRRTLASARASSPPRGRACSVSMAASPSLCTESSTTSMVDPSDLLEEDRPCQENRQRMGWPVQNTRPYWHTGCLCIQIQARRDRRKHLCLVTMASQARYLSGWILSTTFHIPPFSSFLSTHLREKHRAVRIRTKSKSFLRARQIDCDRTRTTSAEMATLETHSDTSSTALSNSALRDNGSDILIRIGARSIGYLPSRSFMASRAWFRC